jgi:hypothetical protein
MPKVQRQNVPKRLFEHLLNRVRLREVSVEDLEALAAWLDGNPEVPVGDWFKRFPSMIVCGHGALIKTFLSAGQSAAGVELH